MAALEQKTLVNIWIERDSVSLESIGPLFMVVVSEYADGPFETKFEHFASIEDARKAYHQEVHKLTNEYIDRQLEIDLPKLVAAA